MTPVLTRAVPLQATPEAAGDIRLVLDELLRGTPLEARLLDARLSATEIVTNAVLHGRQPITVQVSLSDTTLRIEVHDTLAVSPSFSLLDPTAVTGRGLMIVSALADRWGVDPLPDGKSVWIELDTTQPTAAEGADAAALLDAWGEGMVCDPAQEQVRVVLTDLDTARLAASESYVNGLLRELALIAGDEHGQEELVPLARRVLEAAAPFEAMQAMMNRQLTVALTEGRELVDVSLTITRVDAELVRDYGQALEEADRLAGSGRLLTQAPDLEVIDTRKRFLHRILAQLSS